ncbi:hypothetical protein GCM10010399_42350 [Dactylosporangium fulvum]|uniref:Uncharacterized protein n=1 Tax=Dactylosporangium fulvum TaxID=53359 RepID=A0ABY5VWF6_9ACTN|nr:hypothetical protein [Dactylosporangium fulvum]UWP81585.1 hypothetical protein Dfulv_41785 [Dactylosporangium fulvum]
MTRWSRRSRTRLRILAGAATSDAVNRSRLRSEDDDGLIDSADVGTNRDGVMDARSEDVNGDGWLDRRTR